MFVVLKLVGKILVKGFILLNVFVEILVVRFSRLLFFLFMGMRVKGLLLIFVLFWFYL